MLVRHVIGAAVGGYLVLMAVVIAYYYGIARQMLGKETAERIRALYPAVKGLFVPGYTRGVLGTQGVLETGVNLLEKAIHRSVSAHYATTLRQVISADS